VRESERGFARIFFLSLPTLLLISQMAFLGFPSSLATPLAVILVIRKSDGKEWKFRPQNQTVGAICKTLGDRAMYLTDIDGFTLSADEVIPPGTYFTDYHVGMLVFLGILFDVTDNFL